MNFSTETSNLILRTFQMTDASDYFYMVQDPSIQKYTEGAYIDNLPETEFCFKTIYTKPDLKNDFYIAVEEKASHKLIGAIIVVRTIGQTYEASYFISKNFRGNGYMKEALQQFLKEISVFMSGCITFDVHKSNHASLAVVKSIDGIQDSISNEFSQMEKFFYHVR